LPILARVPLQRRTQRHGALPPAALSPGATEGYRTLRATLAAQHGDANHAHAVLVTSSGASEGKSTTAINLAVSLAQAGHKVILIEADMLRPSIGRALGVVPDFGIAAVLIRQISLGDALVTHEESGQALRMLLVERAGAETADRLSLPGTKLLIDEAEALADHVVIDSPPLNEVADALPLAREVDSVVITARLGKSNLRKLTVLGELLQQQGIRPAGVTLVGVKRTTNSYYYARARPRPADAEPVASR
jgi:capsular exopolysaccharide synthesis family protein